MGLENGAGQEALEAAVDEIFADIEGSSMPGCAVGVIHDGEYVLKRGYGLANLEHGIPITPQSVFRTGSLSKQFTSMAIAILAQRGDLDLDADVHEYLPEWCSTCYLCDQLFCTSYILIREQC